MLTFNEAQSVSKRLMLIVCALILSAGSIIAQNINVTGKVTDKTGEPLIGVYVVEEGTSNGISTDLDGKFQLVVNSNGKLVFSLIGMKTQTISVEGRTTINVVMEEDAMLLDDIVVVGYGTQKKENLTGAVASVDVGKTLTARAITDVGRGLQGSTPGLTITIPSGEIGSDPIMKIRGQIGSIEGSSSPLILLDNVEIPSLSLVNPNDIESISVLKDAASASIYGAKAAFGVILITTKKGAKTESVNISYSGNVAFQNIAKKMEMAGVDGMEYSVLCAERVGATEYGALGWYVSRESWQKAVEWQNKYGSTVSPYDDMLYGRDWYVDPADTKKKYGIRTYDPYDYMIREWTPAQNHNVSLNGKSGRVSYAASFGYIDQQGVLKTAKKDEYSRYNGMVKVSADINDYITLRAGGMFSKQLKSYPYTNNPTAADPWLYLYRWGPTYPYTTEDGEQLRNAPYEMGAANTATRETNYTNFNVGATITPLKGWEINFDYTYAGQEYIERRSGTRFTAKDIWSNPSAKLDDNGNQIYVNSEGEVVDAGSEGAMAAYAFNKTTYTGVGSTPDLIYRLASTEMWNTFNVNTTYDLDINDAHAFKFMVGINSSAYEKETTWGQKTTLIDYDNPQFDLATGTQTAGGSASWESQFGVFGRINYNYKERYLAEVNLRYDGTSKFPTDMQWRTFPSFSLGWRMSEEAWMKWAKPVLSTLKFRGSYGVIGDQTVANSLYIPELTGATTSWIIGSDKLYKFNTPSAVSQSITWQDIATLDLGFDARFFSGDLGITFDWYRRDANNMIVPQEGLPLTYGTGAPKSNYGSLRTNGYELQIDYNHRFDNGLGLSVVGTFADAVTKVTKYGDTKSIDSWYVGKTYGEIWGYETDRLYQIDDFELYNGELQLIEVDGYQVYKLKGENPAYQGKLQSGNFIFGPGDVKFVDQNGDGRIDDGNRLIENAEGKADYGDLKVIGNETPRYEYSLRIALDYKGFDFSIFGQGIGKREIWGAGFLAIPGYNAADGAMPQAIAGNFWREDRTDAFYPRPYNMSGSNTGNNMQKQSRYLLDMSYFRIKNITLGYTLPENITRKAWISKLRVYVALENFFTFDNLHGLPIDPESINGYSMFNTTNYNLGRTATGTPAFKNVSVGLELNF